MKQEIIGDCTLYLGDCTEILPTIGMVDHCITDPPYGVDVYLRMRSPDSAGGNRLHKIKGGDSLTAMKKGAIGDLGNMYTPVSEFCARAIGRWALIFSDAESIHLWREAQVAAGMRYARTGIWIKPDAMPQMTGDRPGVGFEPCTITHSKAKMKWNGGGRPAAWTHFISKGANRPDHPCPKPLSLMQQLVTDFTDEGEIVIDPFLGSGTTGAACVKMGRRFIGIEIDQKYFDGACKRIEDAYRQADMFIAPPQFQQPSKGSEDNAK